CAPPGTGLPPLPGTPGFADRLPSYELLVFESATGAFLGTEHLLRPDIYQQGQPPCPQQPGGHYLSNPRNDTWFCNRLGVAPSAYPAPACAGDDHRASRGRGHPGPCSVPPPADPAVRQHLRLTRTAIA